MMISSIFPIIYQEYIRRCPWKTGRRSFHHLLLTGYDAAIAETARLTDQRVELDEYERQALNEKLQFISEHLNEHPKVSITCFVPDARKEGGEYVTVTGNIKKLDDYEHRIVLMDGSRILMEDVTMIDMDLLKI